MEKKGITIEKPASEGHPNYNLKSSLPNFSLFDIFLLVSTYCFAIATFILISSASK